MGYQGDDRRRFPRATFPCKIVVGSPLKLFTSHTVNISEGGIRLVLDDRLPRFIIVGIEISFVKDKPIKCKGRVTWVTENLNPVDKKPIMFYTGIEFTEISDYDREYIRKLVEKILEENG